MFGMNGSTIGRNCSGTLARIAARGRVPDADEVVRGRTPACPGTGRRAAGGTPFATSQLRGELVARARPEQRPGDREADGAADLPEERQVRRRDAELGERHRVLDDDREDRQRRPDRRRRAEPARPRSTGRSVVAARFVNRNDPTTQQRRSPPGGAPCTCPVRDTIWPADDARGDDPDQQRDERVAARRRALAEDHLVVARQEDDRGEEAERGEEASRRSTRRTSGRATGRAGRSAPSTRLLDEEEDGQEREPEDDEAADRRVGPLAGLLVRQADEERDHAGDEDRAADQVEVQLRRAAVGPTAGRRATTTSETSPSGMLM